MSSSDPLLSTLCRICNTNPPKYTCPRCSLRTCSLPCTKRHKVWSSCSGIRDPTVYVPRSKLATPAGIDHDYNFISSIERNLERSEKIVIEEKKLLAARGQRAEERDSRRKVGKRDTWVQAKKGDIHVHRAIEETGVMIDRAPRGMSRQVANGTTWNKREKALNWQVEWIQDGEVKMSKILETKPISAGWEDALEEERRRALSAPERRAEKKRKDEESSDKEMDDSGPSKRRKGESGDIPSDDVSQHLTMLASALRLQDPSTGAWSMSPPPSLPPKPSKYAFYLLKPHTSPQKPKVLIPLSHHEPLRTLLSNQVILEFPTIYVFADVPGHIKQGQFMLEDEYLGSQPKSKANLVDYGSGSEEESAESEDGSEDEVSDTSSSGTSSSEEDDSDEDME
jgi:hypothetical protein